MGPPQATEPGSGAEPRLVMDKSEQIRSKALADLHHSEVLMRDGHFDYGNGYHGRLYLNPHQLFRHPSTIWRFAQDLIDLLPSELIEKTQVVAGPATGGALLAHTIAGLLDSRRSLTHPPCSFAPFNYDPAGGFALRPFYRRELAGKRVLLARTEAYEQRCAQHVHGHSLIDGSLNRPAAFPRILHEAGVALERGVFR